MYQVTFEKKQARHLVSMENKAIVTWKLGNSLTGRWFLMMFADSLPKRCEEEVITKNTEYATHTNETAACTRTLL